MPSPEGTWYHYIPSCITMSHKLSLWYLLPHSSLKSNISKWATETTLPPCHLMLLKVCFIHVSTPFSFGSPELLVCSSAIYSLFLMLLNNGSRYPLVQHVFIKHLQCIMYLPGYWQQSRIRHTLSQFLGIWERLRLGTLPKWFPIALVTSYELIIPRLTYQVLHKPLLRARPILLRAWKIL